MPWCGGVVGQTLACGILNESEVVRGKEGRVRDDDPLLSIMEVTGQIVLVPPFFENFGKRLVKSPKLYFTDSGLACHLLGLESERDLNRSPFLGAIFEGFVASEILKYQIARGRPRQVYYFRDQQGLEVDFLVPTGSRGLVLVEAKASRTAVPQMAAPLDRLSAAISHHRVSRFLVYRPQGEAARLSALRPGVEAGGLERLLTVLEARPHRV